MPFHRTSLWVENLSADAFVGEGRLRDGSIVFQHASPRPMTRGFVSSFDARRGTGFVQQSERADRIPFSLRGFAPQRFEAGEAVEFAVIGGKAGVRATEVRSLKDRF